MIHLARLLLQTVRDTHEQEGAFLGFMTWFMVLLATGLAVMVLMMIVQGLFLLTPEQLLAVTAGSLVLFGGYAAIIGLPRKKGQ